MRIKASKMKQCDDTLRGLVVNSEIPYCFRQYAEAMTADVNALDIQTVGSNEGNFTGAWLNIDGWQDRKAHFIGWILQFHRTSVLFLLDTRLDETQCSYAATKLKSLLGIGYMISSVPVKKPGVVGGIIAITDPTWKHLLTKRTVDAHHLKLHMALSFKTIDHPITIIGTYWPCKSIDKPGSLWNQTLQCLAGIGTQMSPIDYVKRSLEDLVMKLATTA